MNRFAALFAALIGLCLTVLPATGQSNGAYVPDNVAEIGILPGWRAADGRHVAALRIRLAPGWKTYWRAPGDAGIPPSFDWSGSRNLTGVAIHWPVPEVFEQNGMRTIGYQGDVILPMTFTPKRAGRKITLAAEVDLGVCRDVCMPMRVQLSGALNAQDSVPDPMIERAINQRPDTAAEAGIGTVTCEVDAIDDGLRVTARLSMPRLGAGEVAVIETLDQAIWVSETQTSRRGNTLTARSDLVQPSGKPFLISRSDLRITILANGRAVDVPGCLAGS